MQLGVRDAARILNVSEKMVHRWIQQDKIPFQHINDQYYFNRTELLEWANTQRLQISADFVSDASSGDAPMPDLEEALIRGGIHYRVTGSDKNSLMAGIVRLIPLSPGIDRDFILRVLLAREALGSTGIGDGIAIPHVRSPIVLPTLEPTISLCFTENPVDFGAVDGLPVHCLFTVISPTVRIHLHLLARLSFALQKPDFKNLLKVKAPADQILAGLKQTRPAQAKEAEASDPGGGS